MTLPAEAGEERGATPQGAGASPEERLCLACGLCCNGVLFKDVELQEADDPSRLSALGLPLRVRGGRRTARSGMPGAPVVMSCPQPCAALLGCRCSVYSERPSRCRQFDCALLLRMREGRIGEAEALRAVRETRRLTDTVLRLFRDLGDRRTSLALSLRFQRLRRQMEEGGTLDEDRAEVYATLTLAVHDLQRRLRQVFYP